MDHQKLLEVRMEGQGSGIVELWLVFTFLAKAYDRVH